MIPPAPFYPLNKGESPAPLSPLLFTLLPAPPPLAANIDALLESLRLCPLGPLE